MPGPFPINIPPFPGLAYLSSEAIASFASAVGFSSIPATAQVATLSIEGGNVRWGTATVLPTGDAGAPVWGTSIVTINRTMFSSIRFINMTGSTATGTVNYYG